MIAQFLDQARHRSQPVLAPQARAFAHLPAGIQVQELGPDGRRLRRLAEKRLSRVMLRQCARVGVVPTDIE